MTLTSKSRVVPGPVADPAAPEVRPARTSAALGTSSIRGAAAPVARNAFAGRSLALLVALFVLGGCDLRQSGNGAYGEKTVHVGDFTGVRMQDGVGAVITVGPGLTQSVTVTGDENIVENNIRTSVDVEGVGSAAVSVLHVWASPSFVPVIPPRVVISRPSLSLARGSDGVVIEVTRPAGSTAVGGPLVVLLDGATVSARGYPTAGAVVDLDGGSTALLHSDGPVTGTVSADSRLDNTSGVGPCLVPTMAAGNVICDSP
jgi:hypothetical protein